MSTRPDDWENPRGRHDHLTAEEISKLEQSFKAKRTPRDAARDLKCSSRTAYRYFKIFEERERPKFRIAAEPANRQPRHETRHTPKPAPSPTPPSRTVGRFYKGNFDL